MSKSSSNESISYIKQMLTELRAVAETEQCDMLCFLLEMAYLEAAEMERKVRRPQ